MLRATRVKHPPENIDYWTQKKSVRNFLSEECHTTGHSQRLRISLLPVRLPGACLIQGRKAWSRRSK